MADRHYPVAMNCQARLSMSDGFGRRVYAITVVQETRTRYVFRAGEDIPSRRGRIRSGALGKAPKHAITFSGERHG